MEHTPKPCNFYLCLQHVVLVYVLCRAIVHYSSYKATSSISYKATSSISYKATSSMSYKATSSISYKVKLH